MLSSADSFVVIERLLGPRPTHSCMTNKEGPCGTCKRRHTARPRGSKGIACRETGSPPSASLHGLGRWLSALRSGSGDERPILPNCVECWRSTKIQGKVDLRLPIARLPTLLRFVRNSLTGSSSRVASRRSQCGRRTCIARYFESDSLTSSSTPLPPWIALQSKHVSKRLTSASSA